MKKANWWILSIVWIVPISLLIPAMYSCGPRAGEKTAEEISESLIEASTGQKVDIDKKGEKVVMEANGIKTTIDQNADSWPSGIPSEVPVFKEGRIDHITTTEGPEFNGWSVSFQDVNTPMLDAYDKELKSAGFETMLIKINEGGSLGGEKGNLTVNCMQGEDGIFMVSVQDKKN